MWMLDLCSGLGGASEAFVQNRTWEVVRIEINPVLQGVQHTHQFDVLEWMDWLPKLISEKGRPCFVWASPPCLEFSLAYAAPGPTATRAGLDFEPDMSIVEACIDIIQYCGPTFWIIENVHGATQWFLPELGKHQQKIGPFYLWGRFPRLNLPEGYNPSKDDNDVWSDDPLRANKKAVVPIEISNSVLEAISAQSTLSDWA
jgi:site-specific DNA-cytosine methylase